MTESWESAQESRERAHTGETLDGFSNWHQIGRGGDANVYRAIQDSLGREVAVKVLTLDDDESVRRFKREVRLMVSLGRRHPNIAKVIQIGTSSLGRPCIVMEYYELGSLDQRLSRSGPLSADEVIRVGTVIADALDFAHDNGVLHRDVKPQNILILPTSYVLADFGIARLIDSANTSSADRFSYRHASPQVLDGFQASESDDIFSLGATMFHLLDGKPPFTTTTKEPDSALAYIKRVRLEEPRPLNRPDVPPELSALIAKCLRKDPAERFRSAGEVRDHLAMLPTHWPESPNRPAQPTFAPARQESGPQWGIARGQVRGTEDLTAVRLGSARSADSADSTSEPPVVATAGLGARTRWSGPSRLGVMLAGIAAGALLVVVGALALANSDPERTLAVPPTVAPTSAPTEPAAGSHNPNLAPRNLQVTISGNTATATWQRAAEEPETYGWGVTAQPEDDVSIARLNLPSERRAQTSVDPEWVQVCFTVVGMRDGQLGGTQECVPR
ncbi:serine/threonine-protein kinase [Granulicoccus sp. GXG6511]|uniref:serine/threonine-protein kinase n=1 Tax=Granulicoccus sp. GXG6511 TaxID=3381351 RepID=UPI003D7E1D4C